MKESIDDISRLMLETLTLRQPPDIPERYASVDSLVELRAYLLSLREFLNSASTGDLSGPVDLNGYLGGTLKTLQANLRHLTWQTKMVASGDLTQRADFMGDFSEAFNIMVMQLDTTISALVKKDQELSEANESLRLLAITDPLTGLNNRRHFFELAVKELNRALRYSHPLAFVMFDVDHFKRVNDTYGHIAGDAVLRMVAEVARATVRAPDVLGRYGGEEFIVLMPETTAAVAAEAAERLRLHIQATPVLEAGHVIKVTASFGVSDEIDRAENQPDDKALLRVIDRADQALYASKSGGRNRVTVHRT